VTRVILNVSVWVITLLLPDLSFSPPELPEVKTCAGQLFSDGAENACPGSLEKPHHRYCPAHHAYKQRSCARYHLQDKLQQNYHIGSVEQFVQRVNSSLVSYTELAMRREHVSLLRLSTDILHRNWEWKLQRDIDNYLDTEQIYPQIKADAFKKDLIFFIDDINVQVEKERKEAAERLKQMNFVPHEGWVGKPYSGEGENWD